MYGIYDDDDTTDYLEIVVHTVIIMFVDDLKLHSLLTSWHYFEVLFMMVVLPTPGL
jgi:hypothetical protein